MPKYKITGKSRETGRKRSITLQAFDEIAAKVHAECDGVDVIEIVRLPEEPPTERQIDYAISLGVEIPDGATKGELSDLISVAVDKDKPSDVRHIEFARIYGVDCTAHTGKKAIFDRIQNQLIKPGHELKMISWFAFRVYRGLVSGNINPELDDPRNAVFTSIAQELISDEKVIKSIKRYIGRDLIWFGEWTSPNGYLMSGGSNQTIAYKAVSKMLKERLALDTQKNISNNKPPKHELDHGGKGCLFVVFALATMPILGILLCISKFYN